MDNNFDTHRHLQHDIQAGCLHFIPGAGKQSTADSAHLNFRICLLTLLTFPCKGVKRQNRVLQSKQIVVNAERIECDSLDKRTRKRAAKLAVLVKDSDTAITAAGLYNLDKSVIGMVGENISKIRSKKLNRFLLV